MTTALGSFLGQAVSGYGAMLSDTQRRQQNTLTQEDITLKQQQIQQNQQAQQAQQEQKSLFGRYASIIGSNNQADAAAVNDPIAISKKYDAAAQTAMASGDFSSAKEFLALGSEQRKLSKEARQEQTEQKAAAYDELGTASMDFLANPTANGYAKITRAAISAGVNPQDIPMPTDPQFPAWARAQEMKSKTASKVVEADDKLKEKESDRAEKQKEFAAREAERLLTAQQTAAHQRMEEGLRQQEVNIQAKRLALEQEKMGGTDMTAKEKSGASSALAGAAQVQLQLQRFEAASPIDTSGVFATLKAGGSITDALSKVAGNTITPTQQQILSANSAGMGKNIANTLTAVEGGRAPTEAQAKAIEAASAPQAGDTVLTSLYKNAAVKEEMAAAIGGRTLKDPQQQARQQELLAFYKPAISSIDIIKFVRDHGTEADKQAMLGAQKSLGDASSVLASLKSKEPDTSKPSEWSFKEIK